MSATTPDVPLHPHTDRWVFRSGGESGRVSRAERRGVYGDDEARHACADASEKPDLPWHRTTSSSRILTLRRCRVKAFLSLGEFAHDATAGIFNDYVALQVWAGTPGANSLHMQVFATSLCRNSLIINLLACGSPKLQPRRKTGWFL